MFAHLLPSKIIFICFIAFTSLLGGCSSSHIIEKSSPRALSEEAYYQKNFAYLDDYQISRYLFNLNKEIEAQISFFQELPCHQESSIKVVNHQRVFAITTSKAQILISNALIMKLDNVNELYFIIAHEHAHLAKCDQAKTHFSHDNLEQELTADLIAAKFLFSTGRPISAAYSAINRLYDSAITTSHSTKHPSQITRLKNLNQIPKNKSVLSIKEHKDFIGLKQRLLALS